MNVDAWDDRVRVTRVATAADHSLVTRIYDLYLHDISEFNPSYRLTVTGDWRPNTLEARLKDQNCQAFVIWHEQEPTGCALVTLEPSGAEILEFFVLRRWRRRRIGWNAALRLFGSFRGPWRVRELPSNQAAVAFWRTVINSYTEGNFTDGHDRGYPVQAFRND